MHSLLYDIGLAIVAATVVGIIMHRIKQPIILGYLITGAIIGPDVGFGLIRDIENIELISEIGLILLLFIIGLEMKPERLLRSGKQLLSVGISQYITSVLLGLAFFAMIGYTIGTDDLAGLYLALVCGLSSTAIVVKALHDKFETESLQGTLTISVLIIQDIWAILLLALQPSLTNPYISTILIAIAKTVLLVLGGFLVSRYVLKYIFHGIINAPEMVLIVSIGWCTLVASVAGLIGLSKEMGALIAGISISSYQYSIHVTAKTIPLRDFFLTLFFISLGMKIVQPSADIIVSALAIVSFIWISRFVTVYPVVRLSGGGHRTGVIASLNLAQLSEFALVVVAVGIVYGHVEKSLLSLLIYAMAISSVISSYAIKYSHSIFTIAERILVKLGIAKISALNKEQSESHGYPIVLLGFHRAARLLITKIQERDAAMLSKILVVDFNTEVLREIRGLGIAAVYGDIGSFDTLQHAHLDKARIIMSSIHDVLLKNVSNKKVVELCRQLTTEASIVVIADSVQQAEELIQAGATDIVFPYEMVADRLLEYVESVDE